MVDVTELSKRKTKSIQFHSIQKMNTSPDGVSTKDSRHRLCVLIRFFGCVSGYLLLSLSSVPTETFFFDRALRWFGNSICDVSIAPCYSLVLVPVPDRKGLGWALRWCCKGVWEAGPPRVVPWELPGSWLEALCCCIVNESSGFGGVSGVCGMPARLPIIP